jgi:dTDP-4-dehydrorhamnose reductase
MWLVIGGDSEVGAAAYRAFKAQGRPVLGTTRRANCVAADRPLLDLAAPLKHWEPPPQTRAVCICAAVARLTACAADPAGSAYINVTQTLALIERLIERGIYVLFLSSNQVFNGWVPNMPPEARYSPISEYGGQKVQTESVLRDQMARGAPIAILRLSKIIPHDIPLIRGWIDSLTAGRSITAFRDMMLAPAPTDLVIAAIGALLDDRAPGIFQLTGPRDVSYVEVAQFLASHLGAELGLVREISAVEAGMPKGATPRHTTLLSSLMRERYGLQVPDVWEVIGAVMAWMQANRYSHA